MFIIISKLNFAIGSQRQKRQTQCKCGKSDCERKAQHFDKEKAVSCNKLPKTELTIKN